MHAEQAEEIDEVKFRDLALMDGESVDSTLNFGNGRGDGEAAGADVIVLTDKRVIQIGSNGRSHNVTFVSLKDVDTVEVTKHKKGYSGYVWGALAVVVAIGVWQVWDSPTWSPLAALAVLFMGIYLAVDHVISPGATQATFRAGASVLQYGIGKDEQSAEAYAFINRLFQLKIDAERDGVMSSGRFSPR